MTSYAILQRWPTLTRGGAARGAVIGEADDTGPCFRGRLLGFGKADCMKGGRMPERAKACAAACCC